MSRIPFAILSMIAPLSALAGVHLVPVSDHPLGGAEIAAYDPTTYRAYVVAGDPLLAIVDLPTGATSFVDLSPYGAGANSVAVHEGLVAVAVAAERRTDPGVVVLLDGDGLLLDTIPVGALPDMITFTPDGATLLVANEGEPSDDYTIDPEGSVSVVDVATRNVATADFNAWTQRELPGVRVFGPGASLAEDLEPEYIAVASDGATAWITLQENDAVAILDVTTAAVTDIVPLGSKDHADGNNRLDASDLDGGVNMEKWPVRGFYLPDAIASFQVGVETFLVTANEGDSRDYDGFSEESRVAKVTLDPAAFPDREALRDASALGRLKITTSAGDTDGDGDFDVLYAFGARSISVWDAAVDQVWDSGAQIERRVAQRAAEGFNSDNEENDTTDARSDDKGPEPEGVTVGEVDGVPYAFVTLERVGGVVVFDLSNPTAPELVDWCSLRDFDAKAPTDLGPEGVVFVPAEDSPRGSPLLLVSHEVSGNLRVFEVRER